MSLFWIRFESQNDHNFFSTLIYIALFVMGTLAEEIAPMSLQYVCPKFSILENWWFFYLEFGGNRTGTNFQIKSSDQASEWFFVRKVKVSSKTSEEIKISKKTRFRRLIVFSKNSMDYLASSRYGEITTEI